MSLTASNCLIDYTVDKYKSIPTNHPQFSLQRLSERELAIRLGRIKLAEKQIYKQRKRFKAICELKTFCEYDRLAAEYGKSLTEFFKITSCLRNGGYSFFNKEKDLQLLMCNLKEKKAELQEYIYKVDVLQALLESENQHIILRKNINVCTLESFRVLLIEGYVKRMDSEFVKSSLESLFDWEIYISEQLRASLTKILGDAMGLVNRLVS